MKMKVNIVLNMKNRIEKVSNPIYRLNNLKEFYDIMKDNSFPTSLLNKLIYSLNNTPSAHPRPSTEAADNTARFYRTIPFVNGLSKQLISVLSTIPGLRVALKNTKTVRNIYTRLKDTTPVKQQSEVVYLIPCKDCQEVYIGQTSRNLSARITSHKSDTRTNKSTCQLAKHNNELNHAADYEGVKILDSEVNYKKRTFLEMVRIAQTSTAMNSRRDIEGLSSIYVYLLELDKNSKIRTRSATTNPSSIAEESLTLD